MIEGLRVFDPIAHLAGQTVPGLALMNCSALIFLNNSSLFLHSGQEVISIHLIIPSGSIINVPLAAIPV